MAKYTQNNTINLTGAGIGNYHYEHSEKLAYITERISPYFSQITIGARVNARTNKPLVKFTCSLFQLLVDTNLRTQFLNYSQESTNDVEITLRKILQNPVAIESNICKIAGKIGDLCLKEKIRTYQIEGYCYTAENYLKGGTNQMFRLSFINDQDAVQNEDVFDLTEYYYKQKEKELQKSTQIVKR